MGCSFCSIPLFRGRQKSRTIDSIVSEAQAHARLGVAELNLVAQEMITYGLDQRPRVQLTDLLAALVDIGDFRWIRLNYLHPKFVESNLLDFVAEHQTVVPYFDMPIQHINDRVLKRMNRAYGRERVTTVLTEIMSRVPDAQVVTSLITGFPGETPTDFEELYNFVASGWFRYVNVFEFSPEAGTPAAALDLKVDSQIARERAERLRRAQAQVFDQLASRQIGQTIDVLIESRTRDLALRSTYPWRGRSVWDGTEDSWIAVRSDDALQIGSIVKCRIDEARGYVLLCEAL